MATCENLEIILFANYFKHKNHCSICFESKIFKIHLNGFDENGCCLLTEEQKKMYSFVCPCGHLNLLNFVELDCEDYMKRLKNNRRNYFALKKKNRKIKAQIDQGCY